MGTTMTMRTSRTQCDEDYYHRSRPRAVGRSENLGVGGGLIWPPTPFLNMVVYDRNHYFGLGPIRKSKLADIFG